MIDRSTFTTLSGRSLSFASLNALRESLHKEGVSIKDVAHSLSLVNRYNGHTPRPYSVGLHLLVSRKIAEIMGAGSIVQLLTLLHDGHESITGDIHSPLKDLLVANGFPIHKLEKAIDVEIRKDILTSRARHWIEDSGFLDDPIIKAADVKAYELEQSLRAKDGDFVPCETKYVEVADRINRRYKPADVEAKFLWVAERLAARVETEIRTVIRIAETDLGVFL